MKFYLVPVGQEFIYQGESYIKTGPLTASPTCGGKTRLLPRSAQTLPPGGNNSHQDSLPETAATQAQADPVALLSDYHHYCLTLLEQHEQSSISELRNKLQIRFQQLTGGKLDQ